MRSACLSFWLGSSEHLKRVTQTQLHPFDKVQPGGAVQRMTSRVRQASKLKLVPLGVLGSLTALTGAATGHRQPPAHAAAASSAPLVFDGVTVVDVVRGKLLPHQRIVIAGNRIQ